MQIKNNICDLILQKTNSNARDNCKVLKTTHLPNRMEKINVQK